MPMSSCPVNYIFPFERTVAFDIGSWQLERPNMLQQVTSCSDNGNME
jgi:hypothetical protein